MPLPAIDQTFAADLSHNALIAVTGDDARAFLHGQFTNDVEALGTGMAQWSGWCSPKGRLLATFLLARGDHGYLMMLPAEIAEPIRKRLTMFVLRSKVKLEDVSGNLARFGVAGPEAARWIEERIGAVPEKLRLVEKEGAITIRLDDERFVIFARAPLFESLAPREAWDASLIDRKSVV